MICYKCGKEIPEGAVFCCWCGAQYGGKICKACGTKLRSDQLFCHECGVRWSSDETQDTEQPHMKAPSRQEGHDLPGETEVRTGRNAAQKLTVFRQWQAGKNQLIFKIYVDHKELGYIGVGTSLCADIVSDQAILEIRYYTNTLVLKVISSVVLTEMDNPQIDFKVSEYATFWEEGILYPKIEITVKGAAVLRQEQRLIQED